MTYKIVVVQLDASEHVHPRLETALSTFIHVWGSP
jgi:hypothetical protein